jgi:hypothetical protein
MPGFPNIESLQELYLGRRPVQVTKIEPQIDQSHKDYQEHGRLYQYQESVSGPAKKPGYLKTTEIKGQDGQPLEKVAKTADQEQIHPGHLHSLVWHQQEEAGADEPEDQPPGSFPTR